MSIVLSCTSGPARLRSLKLYEYLFKKKTVFLCNYSRHNIRNLKKTVFNYYIMVSNKHYMFIPLKSLAIIVKKIASKSIA